MMRPLNLAAAATLLAVGLLSPPAPAGPPLICHAIEIGGASSLPWGASAGSLGKRPATLVADTLGILGSQRSALVHMETLRRASLYIGDDRDAALELVAALMARALDAAAQPQPTSGSGADAALAWLDAGYALACLEQNGVRLDLPGGSASGVTGYGWVKRAVALRADDAEIQFAAAMVTLMAGIPEHAEHLARARALAGEGTLVARNLSQRDEFFGDRAHGRRG